MSVGGGTAEFASDGNLFYLSKIKCESYDNIENTKIVAKKNIQRKIKICFEVVTVEVVEHALAVGSTCVSLIYF